MLHRRDLYKIGSLALGGLMTLGLAIPGVAYLLDPLRRKASSGLRRDLARLSSLEIGVPQAFPILDERLDAWVKHPREPIGSVWLVRQPEGAEPPVIAFTAECPHLGCAIGLDQAGGGFLCPCHQARFDESGRPLNSVSPRGMDALDVALTDEDDPAVVVTFRRFRTQTKEKTPLV